jgi:hypothetical protein
MTQRLTSGLTDPDPCMRLAALITGLQASWDQGLETSLFVRESLDLARRLFRNVKAQRHFMRAASPRHRGFDLKLISKRELHYPRLRVPEYCPSDEGLVSAPLKLMVAASKRTELVKLYA